jgi:hypothetical protein
LAAWRGDAVSLGFLGRAVKPALFHLLEVTMQKRTAAIYHGHRAVEEKIVGWTSCVDPQRCSTPATHGCVVVIERCTCGLYRETESNGGVRFRGRWTDKPKNWKAW